MVTVLFFLAHDPEPEVREEARQRLRDLPEMLLAEVVSSRDIHPKVLDTLARLHFQKTEWAEKVARNENCDTTTVDFLKDKGIQVAVHHAKGTEHHARPEPEDKLPEIEDDDPVDVNSEEFKSKYQLSQIMGVSEKIKIAQTGDKEWRMILIKDSNKLVSGTVIKNPRITEAEVLTIAKSSIQNDEIIRVICANKEWIKNYQIRKALVENHKTPLPAALRYLATLGEKDLAQFAKSKNISSVLATQARKLVIQKKKDR